MLLSHIQDDLNAFTFTRNIGVHERRKLVDRYVAFLMGLRSPQSPLRLIKDVDSAVLRQIFSFSNSYEF